MLEAKHGGRSPHTNPNYQTLIAFKPRQVLLAERSSMATTTMKQCGGGSKTLTINHDQKALLLQSVLGYLERNGFSRALKRLLSEAQIETDNWKTCSLRLEDMYGSYLETCTRAETEFDTPKDQEVLNNGISKKSGDSNSSAIEQTVGQKKKKKSDEGDNNAAENQPENGVAESAKNSRVISAKESLTNSTVELKESEKSTKTADTVSELKIDESTKKQKDKKKKKSKSISESLDGNVEQGSLDSLPAVNKEICDKLKPSLGDGMVDSQSEVKSKDKKKKHKPSTNSLGDDVEHGGLVNIKGLVTDKLDGNVEQKQLDSLLVATEDKSKEDVKFDSKAEGKSKDKKKKKQQQSTDSPFENMHDVPLEEEKVESKEKKRKKEGSVSNKLSGVVPSKEDPIECESKNGSLPTPEDAVDREKKSSKKRKRLASETNEVHHVEKLESEESKRRKTETLEDGKTFERLAEANAKTGDDKHSGKETETGNGAVSPNELQNTSIEQPEVPTNRNLEKDEDKSAAQKTRRKQHEGSAEPKTVNAFQRVKIDEVKFADERLQDNSYWAKGGAEIGYGAKAQEILGQVRGRDFRHEKTKKKRGSYRGGLIDLGAHSVKFNYSDED